MNLTLSVRNLWPREKSPRRRTKVNKPETVSISQNPLKCLVKCWAALFYLCLGYTRHSDPDTYKSLLLLPRSRELSTGTTFIWRISLVWHLSSHSLLPPVNILNLLILDQISETFKHFWEIFIFNEFFQNLLKKIWETFLH